MPAQLVAWRHPNLIAGLVLVDPAHEDFQPWTIRAAESALALPSALRRAVGSADRPRRAQAVREADRRSDGPHARSLLVEAELACAAQAHQRRTSAAESRRLRSRAAAVRRLRTRSQLPDVPVRVLSASQGLPKGMRARGPRCRPGSRPRRSVANTWWCPRPATTSTKAALKPSRRRCVPSSIWHGGAGSRVEGELPALHDLFGEFSMPFVPGRPGSPSPFRLRTCLGAVHPRKHSFCAGSLS
ncbi:hypothetical protein [Streptomyces sp. CB01201]|uniref:hypothetical protein n=1 Tax=Streptomyces sp. CB01201 TaxID=2020324 RepID=UPI003FA34EBA